MGLFLGITVRRFAACLCLDRYVNVYGVPWEPHFGSNFFNLPAHLCAFACMTEISLIVTIHSLTVYYKYFPISHNFCTEFLLFYPKIANVLAIQLSNIANVIS